MKFQILNRYIRLFSHFYRGLCVKSKRIVLGIETSCDDTGAAVIDEDGNVLGEGLKSQMKVHLEYVILYTCSFIKTLFDKCYYTFQRSPD
ncbi:putative tRNA threonylcarbamoyladenosine biosynthesis protein Osgepl1, partial [Stegodyphus mimosarum]